MEYVLPFQYTKEKFYTIDEWEGITKFDDLPNSFPTAHQGQYAQIGPVVQFGGKK